MKKLHSALSALGRRTQEPPISWLMQTVLERPNLISLAAGFTDNETLPVAETKELLDELLARPSSGRPALQYGSTAGLPELRQSVCRRMAMLDERANEAASEPSGGDSASSNKGIRKREPVVNYDTSLYAPERTLVTHGSQQLLYLVAEALCDPGDIVLVEDPTYFVFLGIAQSHGLDCRGVRLTPKGLDLEHLDEVLSRLKAAGQLRRVKLFYTVSYHQNPTGTTWGMTNKRAVAERLKACEAEAGHPIYLLEDAAYRELRFAGKDEPSMMTLPDAVDRVIYTSTFSKPFATGVRVGYGLMPKPIFETLWRIKSNHDFGTSNLIQHLLLRALRSGRYESHLRDLHIRYAKKADTMAQAIRRYFPPTVKWLKPEGGLYVWARLPKNRTTGMKSRCFKTALENEVLYVPGELCYANDPLRARPNHEMRLSFGGATETEICEGIKRLGKAIKQD